MKRILPWLIAVGFGALVLAPALRPERADTFHWHEFGRLPVVMNGRVKPLDTVARTSLLVIHGKQTLREEDREKLTATEWLAEVLFAPERADQRKLFVIHDPEVTGLFKQQREDGDTSFSFAELRPHLSTIDEQHQRAQQVEPKLRTYFQHNLIKLHRELLLFLSLKNTLQPEDSPDFAREVALFQQTSAPGLAAFRAREAGQPYDEQVFDAFLRFISRYRDLDDVAHFLAIPLADPNAAPLRTDWDKMGMSLSRAATTGQLHPIADGYVQLGAAFREGDATAFNTTLAEMTAWLDARYAPEMEKTRHETFFNRLEPFFRAMVLYVAVLLLVIFSWLVAPETLRRTALALGVIAFAVHTAGLVFRVYLQNYPPVTNLYSAAVVVGWGAAGIGLLVERWFRNGVGAASAAIVAFLTLLVAHHLSFGGDTMEMMQAVLDSNFWLSVHVPTIVLGYSATYAAGAVALLYVGLGVLTRKLTPAFARNLYKIAYGIVCFATLLSFVGTVLGGIWADQSWGRFWGWDPKENGAALIVIWCAIILHARWAGLIRERGLMLMAIFGNVITSWSFFGTNLLGVGLHSYGFTSEGAFWLWSFMISQIVIMGLGAVPPHLWRSRPFAASPPPLPVQREAQPATVGGQ